ncbi:MAG: Formamidopyrimidine-DNA glycosylase [uncultured Gemmatimonadetes bacterium]|uniref:Formamidopyrimidine-DNA glycosylase n=1 Tax=uncultured Gemmatimonadota bacterium TaxID=203437 RepID=A0A6J4MHB0_9BACT|nr:MAG: Formamidopyrimidine-DNA glycosylase [uncultured Gemmatimonadota bacterium]
MPELPEVETIVRDLAGSVPGRGIQEVEVFHADLIEGETPAEFARALQGRRVGAVTRRAKNIVFDLGRGDRLLVNLGMTGRLLVPGRGDPAPTHLGVRMRLTRGRELLYADTRRFGRLWRVDEAGWRDFDGRLGVEPLSDRFTVEHLYEMTRKSRVAVKTWLMDQARVVGVGNIYASEALFRARVDPRRPASEVAREEVERIREAVREVLQEAIDFRGTTFLDYRDASGNRGEFYDRLRVYDRDGQPCTRCNRPLLRVVQANRSTFFCEECQR